MAISDEQRMQIRIVVNLYAPMGTGISLDNTFEIPRQDFAQMAEILREFQVLADRLHSRIGLPRRR